MEKRGISAKEWPRPYSPILTVSESRIFSDYWVFSDDPSIIDESTESEKASKRIFDIFDIVSFILSFRTKIKRYQ